MLCPVMQGGRESIDGRREAQPATWRRLAVLRSGWEAGRPSLGHQSRGKGSVTLRSYCQDSGRRSGLAPGLAHEERRVSCSQRPSPTLQAEPPDCAPDLPRGESAAPRGWPQLATLSGWE